MSTLQLQSPPSPWVELEGCGVWELRGGFGFGWRSGLDATVPCVSTLQLQVGKASKTIIDRIPARQLRRPDMTATKQTQKPGNVSDRGPPCWLTIGEEH